MESYLGVIQALGFSFVPRTFGACAGALIAISQNTALFSLLGTQFGGDGRTNFGLPEMRGRIPMGFGAGPGLPSYTIGQKVGAETVTLTQANLPAHTHAHTYSGTSTGGPATVYVANTAGNKQVPAEGDFIAGVGNNLGVLGDNSFKTASSVTSTVAIGGVAGDGGGFDNSQFAILNTGQNLPFEIVQPSQVVNYCICMQGVFPSRS